MLTIRNRIAQSLWRQGYVLDEISIVSETQRVVMVSNILLLWILGLLHRRECGRRVNIAIGLGMIETALLQCLYDVHKDTLILSLMPDLLTISFLIMCVIRMSFSLG